LEPKPVITRRVFLQQTATALLFGGTVLACSSKNGDWCKQSQIESDGDFPTKEECARTATNIEGPYYIASAPERNDLRIFGDQGEEVSIEGTVFDALCAKIEFWHADPDGEYDNDSNEMKYRCVVVTDESGAYRLDTLLPGLYRNGLHYRPRHIHIKVWDSNGTERLTSQLYFEGDEHLDCDEFANTSLVMRPTEEKGLAFSNIHIVV
jgi:protocatechuate 3,4-dioxygenase beta subunit